MNSDQNSDEYRPVSILLPENKKYYDLFSELSELYFRDGQTHRGSTFAKAARLLNEDVDVVVTDPSFNFADYSGIGGSTVKELKQFIEKGTSDRLEEMRKLAETAVEFQLNEFIKHLKDEGVSTTMLSVKLLRIQVNTLDKLEKAIVDGVFPEDVIPHVKKYISDYKAK